jgi:hypothetical protein
MMLIDIPSPDDEQIQQNTSIVASKRDQSFLSYSPQRDNGRILTSGTTP